MRAKVCTIDGCDDRVYGRGWSEKPASTALNSRSSSHLSTTGTDGCSGNLEKSSIAHSFVTIHESYRPGQSGPLRISSRSPSPVHLSELILIVYQHRYVSTLRF